MNDPLIRLDTHDLVVEIDALFAEARTPIESWENDGGSPAPPNAARWVLARAATFSDVAICDEGLGL